MKNSAIYDHIRDEVGLDQCPIKNTFIDRLEYMNTYNFLSVLSEQELLFTAIRNTSEKEATEQAGRILNFVHKRWGNVVGNQVVKLTEYAGGPDFANCVICLGPEAALIEYSDLTKGITYSAYQINHIEFAGDETVAEAIVRCNQFDYHDITRDPSPIVFARYKSQSGMHSAKHFAVASQDDVAEITKDVFRSGGWLEFENFERSRIRLVAPGGRKKLEVTCGERSASMSARQALDLLNVLTTQGLNVAIGALT